MADDTPESVGDPIVMHGDNVAAVTWVNRGGGARDKIACLLMTMLGRLEITGGWSHDAKHIPRGAEHLGGRNIALTPD